MFKKMLRGTLIGVIVLGVICAVWVVWVFSPSPAPVTDTKYELPVVGEGWYPDQLPDGNYTIAKILLYGGAVVINHLPGPDRDFIYLVMTERHLTNMPYCGEVGERLSIFHGRIVS